MIPIKPIDATWTDEQWNAIYQDGSNIIVSAGAGSGKTAVLTERIIEKLKQGISISSLIVLTFTKAAAFEMKTRVRKKLKKEIQNGNSQLKKELERLDSAAITTFDSYSLSLVKKYHYLLGIKKDIEIADNIVLNMKKKELLNQVFDEFYQKKDASFFKLLDTFTVKDDNKIKEMILKLNDSIESLAHKKEYLEEYLENYYNEEMIEKKVIQYESLLNLEKEKTMELLENLKLSATHPVSIDFVLKIENLLEPLSNCTHYDDYKLCLGISFPSFTRSKKVEAGELETLKQYYDSLKASVERMKELCVYESRKALSLSIMGTKETVKTIIALLKQFDQKLFEYKKNESLYEFSDIARLAISLLENHPNICEQLKADIHEIMIDEYQDTNDIGDYFISLISNHNVYMVGDIKQSIYRFRNANPNIFMEKYNHYTKHEGGEKIDLNKNFRSRKEVLDDINFLFLKFMDEEIGGADYQSGHAMVFGNETYEKNGKTQDNHHFTILDYEYKESMESKLYKQEEIEAFIIGMDIKEKVKNHYQVFDKDENYLRDVTYHDFAILLDRKTSFDLYKKIFTYLEIPLMVHKDESFVYSDEVFVILNIMKWILSYKDSLYAKEHLKYSIMSVARSFVGNIKDEELFVFLMEQKEDLVAASKLETSPIYEISKKIELLADYSRTHTLSELLEKIYEEFDIYHAILELQNIEFLSIKLDYLLDVTRNLEKQGYQIVSFIQYLEEAILGKTDVTFQRNQDSSSNSVAIMTIHKSKGLEFHICYYAGLQKKFSKADLKEKFLFDHKLGFIVPYFEEGIRETFYKELLKEEWNKEDISERIRVFYVALSRAKEKMIFVTNLSDNETTNNSHDMVSRSIRLSYQSFYDILLSIKSSLKPYIKPISLEQIPLTKNYEQVKEVDYEVGLSKSSYQPDYITVQLEKKKIEEKHFSESYHMIDSSEQEKLAFGVKLHECLQYVDYTNVQESLEKMQLSSFEKRKLETFFHSDFFKELENPKFYQELEFVEQIDGKEFHGVIDLLIIDSKKAYVIDYKLKNIEKETYENQVKGYQKLIEKRLSKPVVGILYSLLDETYKMV